MQFVFYALLDANNERIDIGETEEERKDYAKTALWTAIVYVGYARCVLMRSIMTLVAWRQTDRGLCDLRGSRRQEETA